jgi:ABC-type glycerol-3-phosphate transport system permease component
MSATTGTTGEYARTEQAARRLLVLHWRDRSMRTVYFVIALVGAAFMVLPVFWMLSTALKPGSQVISIPPVIWPLNPNWNSFGQAMTSSALQTPFINSIKNSLIVTLLPVIGDTLSAALVAYGFARLRAPGSTFLFFVVLATIMVPFQVTVLPQYILFNQLGWVDSFLPLIVPAFFGNAFNIFLLRQFFRGIPRELDEAAMIDGVGYFGIFWRIILPLSKPALAAVAVFSFVYHWNDFFYPLIYINSASKYPVPYAIAAFANGAYGLADWNHLMALGLISALPCLALFFVAQRYFIQGIVVSGVKG